VSNTGSEGTVPAGADAGRAGRMLLVEIGCEELPASACREAEAQLPALVEGAVGKSPDELYVGPRRLAVLVRDLPERTADEWIKGPPESRRQEAAPGFAKRHGVEPEQLEVRDGFLGLSVPGKPIVAELPDRVRRIVEGLSFSKSMRWPQMELRFSRPVRWVLAMLDDELVEGRTSFGHRFTHGAVEIDSAEAYSETLRAALVEPDARRRREQILAGLPGGWSDPLGKLDEVVYMVEWPTVLEAEFDERFLALPERVVVTAMQSHQRYFPLGGNRFAFVANGGDPEVVRQGNATVLEARLDDASFTFERDVARGVEALAAELDRITFFAGAGTFAEKTARLVDLVRELGGGEASLEAARLAKADQASELVREFPDLEGHIGAHYAGLAGYPEAVCAAIDEHYLPDSAGGPLPRTEAGKVLAAADKVDNLNVSFGLGHRPTGSRDPYGLRRDAIGLSRLALEGGISIPLSLLSDDVRDFVGERLEGLLDVPVEFVRAARSSGATEVGDLARLAQTLAALEDGRLGRLHTAFSRAHRLAGKADGAAAELDAELLAEPAEREVAEVLGRVSPQIEQALAASDLEAAIGAAEELGAPVDRFFDEVLVMADDSAVRANRLRLLLDVRDAVGLLGDFTQIPR
jgi:glycyl-tRNA synthetase beta chain